jgi:hypothetical protein
MIIHKASHNGIQANEARDWAGALIADQQTAVSRIRIQARRYILGMGDALQIMYLCGGI